jgi:excisionase family DNA binding protein
MRKRYVGSIPVDSGAKLLLSVEEAAILMSLGRSALYDLLMRNEIVSIKVGRTRRVPLAALHEYIQRQLDELKTGA